MTWRTGLADRIKRRTAITADSQWFGTLFLQAVLKLAPWTKVPWLGAALRRVARMAEGHPTAGYTIPLAVDVSDELRPMTLPIELMRNAARSASYRAILDQCLCRHTFECQRYPHEVGCLFLGEAARVCVANGIARPASVDECLSHIERAARLGLVGKAYWIEIESYVWGVPKAELDRFLELCFCCPCCCAAFAFDRRASDDARRVLNRSIGWTVTTIGGCDGCGACVTTCPRELLARGTPEVVIDERCSGCGLCVPACPRGALKLVQIGPVEPAIERYFSGVALDL